jgi:hypothetical protein
MADDLHLDRRGWDGHLRESRSIRGLFSHALARITFNSGWIIVRQALRRTDVKSIPRGSPRE